MWTGWPPGRVCVPRCCCGGAVSPEGLWNGDGTRLSVDRWADPVIDAHRRQVRYDDYRCSVPARSGREGASVRWQGHTNQPEPDTAAEPGRAPDGLF